MLSSNLTQFLTDIPCTKMEIQPRSCGKTHRIRVENSNITYKYSDGKNNRQLQKTTRTRKTSQASTALTVAGVPDSIRAVAVYKVTAERRISTLFDTWLSCTTSQVGHTYASYSIIDSGRTLAIYYATTISNYFNSSQALEACAKFGPSGARYMRANWV